MPRSRTKACQTDTVFLSEQQVENIVRQSQLEAEKTMTSRLNEFKEIISKMQDEINYLKAADVKQTDDLESLNNLQQASEVSVEQLQVQVDNIEEEMVKKVDIMTFDNKENSLEMTMKIDELEQQTKLKNLRIFGLEEKEGEDSNQTIIDFAKKHLNIVIKETEIEARRMGRTDALNNKPRDILVKFDRQYQRNTMFKRKRALQQQNQQVYINEDLTTRRSHLFFQARKLRKQQKLFGAWTQAGNILVKLKPNSTPKAVNNLEEINLIINDNFDRDFDTESEPTSTV